MANAIIRYTRFASESPHIKYTGYQTIDTKSVNNPRDVGRDVINTFKRIIIHNKKLRNIYIENNVYNYLDTEWHNAKSRRFILSGSDNSIVADTKTGRLTIGKLCSLTLIQKINLDTKTQLKYWNKGHTKTDLPHIQPRNNSTQSQAILYKYAPIYDLNKLKRNDIIYISLYDITNYIGVITNAFARMGAIVTIHCLPAWNLGCWIQINAAGRKNISRRVYDLQISKTLEICGMALAAYINVGKRINVDADFQEMFEMFAFNHCYTLARDLNLNIRSRYLNQFGGPQEFIFSQNRFIGDLYPPIEKDKAMELMMTNVGLYSISRVRDSLKLANAIKDACQNMLNIRDVGDLIITDGTAGVGGDTITLAKSGFGGVNSCEIIPEHCRVVANNVSVFELDSIVRVVCGNYMDVYRTLKQDIVYLDAPWGGINYEDNEDSSGLRMFGGVKFVTFVKQLLSNGGAKLIALKVPADFSIHRIQLNDKLYKSRTQIIGRIQLITIVKK